MDSQTTDESEPLMSISEVSRSTGIPAVNLRVWERRYGFPDPYRSPNGERQYSMDHLVRLQTVKGLLALGYRPGTVLGLEMKVLLSLRGTYDAQVAVLPEDREAVLRICSDLIKQQRGPQLKSRLNQELLSAGLRNFVIGMAAPLTRIVGAGRASGGFTILEAYLFNAVLESVMRSAIKQATANYATIEAGPRVLLSAAPLDKSTLELLLIEALFVLEGAHCTRLPAATPLKRVASIGKGGEVDIVVVSFSHKISPRSVIGNTRKLQGELGGKLRVSIDANCVVLVGRSLGWGCVLDLGGIVDSVAKWRRALSMTSLPLR
jgi:DNA-binding transcriptional MerR regulator